jgi:leucyl-tRNA synthetase
VPTMSRRYDSSSIEPKWQEVWAEERMYEASDDPADERPRFYALDMFPYPSGDLHMGHAEAFSGGDTIARYRWMRGDNVLHPIGWDAFGLNAENAAIKRGVDPKEWTYRNIEQQAASFRRMGMSFDWTRRLQTSDPEYYRWTQWLFLRFFERGLAYRKQAPVNWCPRDRTVLANEQVIGGACERCGTMVERRNLTQWFFRITEYAQRLLDDVDQLTEWPERVLTMQRNWIGRSEGATVTFRIDETGEEIEIFTTRPDTLWGVTFFVFSVEHPAVQRLAELGGTWQQVRPLVEHARQTSLVDREAADIREGAFLGVHAVNPVNGERVPCYAAPYVLMEYGTGVIMAVPAHDQRDFEFAREHALPVRVVIQPLGHEIDPDAMQEALPHDGVMVRSGPFDGEPSPASIEKVTAWLETEGFGSGTVHYRLRDWLLSRQRLWGAPIPIVHCPTCGEVAVPDDQLPVLLPDDADFQLGGDSPLARHPTWKHTSCPSCGGEATRDTDTMDTFVDSSWYLFRYCSPGYEDGPFRREDVDRWMPVGQYTGGVEHAILHLLYTRFFTKVLYDLGMVGFTEPFPRLMNQGQVIYDGASMSKTKGNIVEPMPLVERWGADSMRLLMLFAGPFEDDIDWKVIEGDDPNRRPGVHAWLGRVFAVVGDAVERGGAAEEPQALVRSTHKTIKGVTDDLDRFRFNIAISKLQVLTNEMRRTLDAGGGALRAARALVQLLAPFAPFAAEELWRVDLGEAASVHSSNWPTHDPALVVDDTVTMVFQVDGKLRDRAEVPVDIDEAGALERASRSSKVAAAVGDREVVKEVVRVPRLVNIVTKR